jgi:tight adherence protein B
MRRRRHWAAAVAALPLALALPAQAAEMQLTQAGGSIFPDKRYALTLANPSDITTGQVKVLENGEPVDGLSVTPAASSKAAKLGTMLVIDASRSMHGDSIVAAVEGARAFAQERSSRQYLGLVIFNGSVNVAVQPTRDGVAIDNALATVPQLAAGTHLRDATSQALDALAAAHMTSGNVVVLSDGKDTGSAASPAAVSAAARRAHARIYAVGFRDRAFDPSSLTELASATHGQYVAASSKDALKQLYTSLGQVLAHQYFLRYRSTAPLGSRVRVAVRVEGQPGTARDAYKIPKATPAVVGSDNGSKPFWRTNLAVLLVVLGGALLVGLAVSALLAPRRSVRARVGEFVALPEPEQHREWTSTLLQRAFGEGGTAGRARGARGAFAEQLELAGISMTPLQVIAWTTAATILFGWLIAESLGTPGAAVLALCVPLAVRIAIHNRLLRQRRRFDDQLPDNLQVIASAMRAGQTFVGALAFVAADAPEPSRREFRRVLADEQLGVPLVDALSAVATRMHSRDFEHVALVATLQRETGGNTAEVIDQVTETIRERMDLRRLVSTLTAQGRLAGFIVAALPILLIVAISFLNPGYLRPMFHTVGGVFLLVVAGIMLALGAWIISRIVNIKI